ncbi:MAG: Xaa-Pro peptidase family protein [Planctomycetes bacterium]|nr:Xaa-Pro peptidase family protein [Planctomycetota bacterium]
MKARIVGCAFLLLGVTEFGAASAAPQDAAVASATDVQSVERTGNGRPVCGLGREFHVGRRKALCEKLEGGLVLLRGLHKPRDYRRFTQDKVFWYLTGIESPNASVVIDVATARTTLYLPARNRMEESWDGEMWDASDDWVRELTGVDEVKTNSSLLKDLESRLAADPRVWISTHPHVELTGCFDRAVEIDAARARDPLDGRESREDRLAARLRELYHADVQDLTPVLNELRRVKTSEELAALRRAARSGAFAMMEAMRSTRAGLGEWELEAVMSFVQEKEGAAGAAYNAIVGSGLNSLVLHYMASARRMNDGEILLIDYAPEVDHYVSDITRTWPVDGTYDPRQAELYDAVYAAQAAGIAAAKPGAKIADVSRACDAVFQARGLAKFVRHGTCHYVGMEVHDVGEYDAPLVPGVVFTIEPGLYEADTKIGIRIEDVVVITETGCEVITALVPKTRPEIERLIREEGVLDWLARPGAREATLVSPLAQK